MCIRDSRHTERTVKNGSRVHVYHGTKELLGKVILLDREELKAGETCYAQDVYKRQVLVLQER